MRVTLYSWAVFPRNATGSFVRKRKRYETSGFPSPVRSMWSRYLARGENVYQLGPAAGSSAGIQLPRIVTVSGRSGLRNAYRSVASADGSSAMSGASR